MSATLMVVLIGFYNGLTGITEVVLMMGVNVAMILFVWLQELMNPPGRLGTTMMPFWFGCIAGAAPRVAIAINLYGARTVGTNEVPGFAWGMSSRCSYSS